MQKVVWTEERKASCTGATWGCTGAKQGCTRCKWLLGDLCAVGPRDLLHPLLTTFGDFPIFDPSPWRSGLQLYMRDLKLERLKSPGIVRGLLGTGPPDPTLESASPSPPQGSIWHRFNIDSTLIRHRNRVKSGNRCGINVESMLNRCKATPEERRARRIQRVGSGGPEPNKPLTTKELMSVERVS